MKKPLKRRFSRFYPFSISLIAPLKYSLRDQGMASHRDSKLEKLLIITWIADTDMHISKRYFGRKIYKGFISIENSIPVSITSNKSVLLWQNIKLLLPEPLVSWSTSSTRTGDLVNTSSLWNFYGLYRQNQRPVVRISVIVIDSW